MPCSLVEVHGRHGGKYCLHLHSGRASKTNNQQNVNCFLRYRIARYGKGNIYFSVNKGESYDLKTRC
jgi:hypothetical protein